MRFLIENKIINKKQPIESKNCDHKITVSDLIGDTKYRYCEKCGMLAHEDRNFSYICGNDYCRCMQ